MDKRKVIVDYLRDMTITPPYYSMRKDWIIEYSWEHWAVEEIYYRLYHEMGSEKEITLRFINEMEEFEKIAKKKDGIAAKCLFSTAVAIGREIESLLRALE